MIIMLINLSKLLLCTTLKSFYAVKKVKQTKKIEKKQSHCKSYLHGFAVYDIKVCCTAKIVRYRTFFTIQILQLLLLQCETLQICKCRYIHTYHFESLAMKKVKNTCQIAFYVYTKSVYALLHHQRNTPSYIYYSHQKHTPVLLCFDLNYFQHNLPCVSRNVKIGEKFCH